VRWARRRAGLQLIVAAFVDVGVLRREPQLIVGEEHERGERAAVVADLAVPVARQDRQRAIAVQYRAEHVPLAASTTRPRSVPACAGTASAAITAAIERALTRGL
jgi:hypothetical protein